MEEEKLIGPRAEERERKLEPEDARLADGRPIYLVFLKNPEVAVLSPSEAREAKQKLSQIIASNPERVLSCQGKTLEKAKAILSAEVEE